MIASKCHKKGYEVALSILPIPSWETIKQYRQATSTTIPISQDNLTLMVQEMTRRGCKGIGGIHWDEMAINEGIVLCKRTRELVGFEDLRYLHRQILHILGDTLTSNVRVLSTC